jgi:hypothetical protein
MTAKDDKPAPQSPRSQTITVSAQAITALAGSAEGAHGRTVGRAGAPQSSETPAFAGLHRGQTRRAAAD